MGVGEQLKQTSKGRLSYERKTSCPQLKAFLDDCSSPTAIQVSPTFSKNIKLQQKIDNEPEKADAEKENIAESISSKLSPSRASLASSKSGCEEVESVKLQITSPEYSQSQLAIHKYAEEMENRTRRVWLLKQREFEVMQARLQHQAQIDLQQLEQQAHFNSLMKVQTIELKHESQHAEIVKQHNMLKEVHEQRKQIHNARIQEAEMARHRLRQEELRREMENKERLEKIQKSVADLDQLNKKIQTLHRECNYPDYVSEAAKKSMQLIQSLCSTAVSDHSAFVEGSEVTLQHVEKFHDVLNRVTNAYEFVKADLEKAENDGSIAKAAEEAKRKARLEAEAAKKAEEAAAAAAASVGKPLAASTPLPQTGSQVSTSSFSAAAASKGETLCADLEAFRHYMELQEKLKSVDQSTQVLASTAELKKFKLDIQKAVNTPINAISPVSGDHLRDKLKRLLSLLSGQTVEVSGRRFSLSQHKEGTLFSKNLIAKMIVRKGEEQVASKHDSAFAIAMVAVGLWRESPSIGDLLLAHFHAKCPYIVPYYIPKQEGQSDKDYFMARGYTYEDNVVEKQEKFLKRMSGIMRLYFAILVSSPPRGNHPHGIEQGWMWLSRVFNLDPEPDITATMIYDFLQVAGHAMYKSYQKQFLKLLHILVKELFPKLKNISSAAGGGALTRLEVLLEKAVKSSGSIPEPEGLLRQSFWTSL